MRTLILSMALVSGVGMYAQAQTTVGPRLLLRAENPPLSLSLCKASLRSIFRATRVSLTRERDGMSPFKKG